MAKLSRWAVFLRVFLLTLVAGQAGRSGAAEPAEIKAWEMATSEGTAASYYGYLAKYPAGEYVDQAIKALMSIGAIKPEATRTITPRTGARRPQGASTTVPASDDASGDDATVYP